MGWQEPAYRADSGTAPAFHFDSLICIPESQMYSSALWFGRCLRDHRSSVLRGRRSFEVGAQGRWRCIAKATEGPWSVDNARAKTNTVFLARESGRQEPNLPARHLHRSPSAPA